MYFIFLELVIYHSRKRRKEAKREIYKLLKSYHHLIESIRRSRVKLNGVGLIDVFVFVCPTRLFTPGNNTWPNLRFPGFQFPIIQFFVRFQRFRWPVFHIFLWYFVSYDKLWNISMHDKLKNVVYFIIISIKFRWW